MSNEIMLILSLFVIYGGVLVWFCFFGKKGLYCWTAIATIAANIEALILIDAFGMEQTLGNVLFGSTFLVTDILSEIGGKEESKKAVNIGMAASISFIIISQSWFLYTPNANDFISESIRNVFSNTPRLMIVSILVYVVTQRFDVWAYHKWWNFTKKKVGDERKFLWLRNNGSTLISQMLNTVLFTFGAFWEMYDFYTLINISLASYVIFIFTSIADTPAIYIARYINDRKLKKI